MARPQIKKLKIKITKFLSFPDSIGLLPNYRGSAGIPTQSDLSLSRTLPAITVRPHLTKLHRSLYATGSSFDPRQNFDIVPVKYCAVSACRYLGRFEKSL